MDFGEVIRAMTSNPARRFARQGWNGKGMFIWLKPEAVIKEEWCHDPILKEVCHNNGGEIQASGVLTMFTAQHTVVTGWLASQTDMLATDWYEVPSPKNTTLDQFIAE